MSFFSLDGLAPCGGLRQFQVYFVKAKQSLEKNRAYFTIVSEKNLNVDLYWADLSPSLHQ